jgi:hypothetical protein
LSWHRLLLLQAFPPRRQQIQLPVQWAGKYLDGSRLVRDSLVAFDDRRGFTRFLLFHLIPVRPPRAL